MSTESDTEQGLQADVVRALTRAAEYARTHQDSCDFPRFVGQALVTTATNLGGAEQLMGRNGESWEAHHVAALSWTHKPDANLPYGRSPIVVPVNVAEIVDDRDLHPGLLSLDTAIDEIGNRYAAASRTQELDAWDDEIVAVESRYQREYVSYVDRFAVAAEAAAQELGFEAGVYIAADTNPSSCWWNTGALINPQEGIDSPTVCSLWNYAHDTAALPNVDLLYGNTAEHHRLSRSV